MAIGSILHYANNDDVIWGTGINGTKKMDAYNFSYLDVRAVRGPITRKFLLEKGIECPEIYGDPTLLFPFYFPEFKKAQNPEYDYIVIPHFSDEEALKEIPHVVSVKEPWNVVVQKILNSKFVIASALSGIIIAEAYGIPARLLQLQQSIEY